MNSRNGNRICRRVGFSAVIIFVFGLMGVGTATLHTQQQEAVALEAGKPIKRELAGGQTHRYQIKLAATQFVHLSVEQKVVDVKLLLTDPEGAQVAESNFSGAGGLESLSCEAALSGDYHLLIHSVFDGAAAGTYRLVGEIKTTAGDQDKTRIRAEQMLSEAIRLSRWPGMEVPEAMEKLQQSLPLWQGLNDRYLEAVTLLQLGRQMIMAILAPDEKIAQGRAYCERARAMMREDKRHADEGRCLSCLGANNLGFSVRWKANFEKAKPYLEQALTILREVKDRYEEAIVLTHLSRGGLGEANQLGYARQGLAIQRELKDRHGESYAMLILGRYLYLHPQDEPKIDYSQQALDAARKSKNRLVEINALQDIGGQRQTLGRPGPDESVEYFEQILTISQAAKDPAGEALGLWQLGDTYQISRPDKAVEYFLPALAFVREIKNRGVEAWILNLLGLTYRNMGRNDNAIECLQQGLAICRERKYSESEVTMLEVLGSLYAMTDRYDLAASHLEQALSVTRDVKDRYMESMVLSELGGIFLSQGRYEKAIELIEQALRIAREVKSNQEPTMLIDLGTCYARMGDDERAITIFEQARALARKWEHGWAEAWALNNLSISHSALGRNQEAVNYGEQALIAMRDQKDRRGESFTLDTLGEISQRMERFEKAVEYYEQSISISREMGSRWGEAASLKHLGVIWAARDQPDKAQTYLAQALAGWREMKAPHSEAETLYELARLEWRQDRLSSAHTLLAETLNIVEALRSDFHNQELRVSFTASAHSLRQFQIDLLMALHQKSPAEGYEALALEAGERARARGLLELLAEARADIRHGVDAALLERERTLSQQLNAKAARLTQLFSQTHTPEPQAKLNQEISMLEDEYWKTQAAIRKTSPRYAALTQPQPLAAQEIQRLLDADTLLLEYALGDERSWLFAVTPDALHSHQLPPRKEIEAAAMSLYDLLATPGRVPEAEAKINTQAQALSRMLLAPVAAQLGKKRLAIVAAGALQYLPFAALPEPDLGSGERRPLAPNPQPLIVNHEVVNLPSASTLAVLRREAAERKPAPKAVAVLADPVFDQDDPRVKLAGKAPLLAETRTRGAAVEAVSPLKRTLRDFRAGLGRLFYSRAEAEAIYAAVPAGAGFKALDFQADRATALNPDLAQYRIVHFATHGLLNSEHPELSGLVLSLVDEKGQPQDGFLRLHEIYNLKLNAELVVLSACQTALGKEVKGEGLVGLTRGFMYAGAPRVLAGLWKVDDVATSELMKRFYRGVLSEGLRPAAALRAAQIEMWRRDRWRRPFYWAAFTLQGEWQ